MLVGRNPDGILAMHSRQIRRVVHRRKAEPLVQVGTEGGESIHIDALRHQAATVSAREVDA